jgi:mycothiol synthase
MPPPADDFHPFDLRAASHDEYAALNAFKNVQRREVLPEDPPVPCDEDVARWKAIPPFVELAAWAQWDASHQSILAVGEARIHHTGDNPTLMEFNIEVLPEFRRRGLARGLLRPIAEHSRRQSRRLLIAECNDRLPAGGAFLTRIGATRGLEEALNQLRLEDLDRSLVRRWMEASRLLAEDFDLVLWQEAYPPERLAEFAAVLQVAANDEPRDSLELEDANFSPEIVGQWDEFQRAGTQQRWTMVLIDRRRDRIVGLTELTWSPNRPAIVDQHFTGVLPEYRNRGLGRWLKAAMLERILSDLPEVRVIRSGNAGSNAPMLKINRALGFRPLLGWSTWQVKLESVERYLAERA